MYLSDNFGMGIVGRGRPASEVSVENHFGTWLRERRKMRDLTGEALAFRMGGKLTQSSISHYERGTKKPEAATVFCDRDTQGQGQINLIQQRVNEWGLPELQAKLLA